jgi:hypothetical protein
MRRSGLKRKRSGDSAHWRRSGVREPRLRDGGWHCRRTTWYLSSALILLIIPNCYFFSCYKFAVKTHTKNWNVYGKCLLIKVLFFSYPPAVLISSTRLRRGK